MIRPRMGARRPGVLFISASDHRGGAERYLLTVAQATRAAGWRIGLGAARLPPADSVAGAFRALGADMYRLPRLDRPARGRRQEQLDRVRASCALAVLLARFRPAVVHLNLPWPVFGLPYLLTCALLRRPTVVVFHAVPGDLAVDRARRAYRWAQRRNQVWVVVADHQRRKLAEGLGVTAGRIRRIYNGVPLVEVPSASRRAGLRRHAGLDPGDFVVVTVGRLTENKAHSDLIEAVASLREEFPRLRTLIVGEGRTRLVLEALVRERDLGGVVSLTGERHDVLDILAIADVFVFPSRVEGFGLALLEAMAAGCPVVATDIDGVRELVEDGVSGLLVPPGQPRRLAAAIGELAHTSALRRRLATGARSRAAVFSRERMLRETLDLYEQAATRRR